MMILRIFIKFDWVVGPAALPLCSADFSSLCILQAGARGNADAGWEIATGSNLGSITSGTQFRDATTPGWSDNVDRQFRIGYIKSSNTAYTTVWDSSGSPTTADFIPVGGGSPDLSTTWPIRANLGANPSVVPATSVQVSFISFGNGLTVLQPLSTTPLIASQPTGASQVNTAAPIVFSASANSGNWYLDGVIRFSGLSPYATNGARNSDLQFSLTASASDTPEPAAALLVSTGLIAMAQWNRHQNEDPRA